MTVKKKMKAIAKTIDMAVLSDVAQRGDWQGCVDILRIADRGPTTMLAGCTAGVSRRRSKAIGRGLVVLYRRMRFERMRERVLERLLLRRSEIEAEAKSRGIRWHEHPDWDAICAAVEVAR